MKLISSVTVASFLALCAALALQYVGNFPAPEHPWIGTILWFAALMAGLWGGGAPRRASEVAPPGKGWAALFGIAGVALLGAGVALRHAPWSGAKFLFLLAFLSGFALLALAREVISGRPQAREGVVLARAGIGAALGLTWLFWPLSEATYQNLALLPDKGAPLLVALGVGLVVMWGVVERRGWVVVAGLVAGTLALRGFGIQVWEIHPRTRDMLALIQSTQDVALQGDAPYRVYQMQQHSQVPLTYLPFLWLSSAPLRALGLDLRWAHVLIDASVPLALWWGSRRPASQEAAEEAPSPGELSRAEGAALGLGAMWMMLPSVQWNTIYAEPTLWWGVVCWLLATRSRGATLWSALLLGVALCTRHFAVILLPFFLLEWVMQLGWRRALVPTAIVGGICAALLTPFIAADPEIFWFGTLKWLREYGPVHQTWFYNKFGFARALYTSGLITHAPLVQAFGIVAGVALSALLSRRAQRGVMWPMVVSYVLFVMCNGLIWYSFFVGPVLCVALLRERPQPLRLPAERWVKPALAVCVVSLCCGAYIVYTLAVQGAHPGREAMIEELATRQIAPHQLIDDHARQLEFVKPEPLLGRGPTVWSELQQARAGEARAFWRVRDLTRRYDPQIDLWRTPSLSWPEHEALASLTPDQSARHGIYQLEHLTLAAFKGRLSDRMNSTDFSAAYVKDAGRVALRADAPGAPFLARPTLPDWSRVERRACKISGARAPMMFAHPREGEVLELSWQGVEAEQMIVLFGGIEDQAIQWQKADVLLEAVVSHPQRGSRSMRVVLENRPGLRGASLGVSEFGGEPVTVTLRLSTPNAGQRWTCVEGLVF